MPLLIRINRHQLCRVCCHTALCKVQMVLAESVIISVLKGLPQLVKQDIRSAEQDEPGDSGEASTAGFAEEGIEGDGPDRNPELTKTYWDSVGNSLVEG